MPLGLDMVIGSVRRKYEVLPPDHPAVQCVEDCLAVGGFANFKQAARALQCSERNIRQKRDKERPVRYIDVLAAEAALEIYRSAP